MITLEPEDVEQLAEIRRAPALTEYERFLLSLVTLYQRVDAEAAR